MRTGFLLFLAAQALISGCISKVESGDTVEINYLGKLKTGEVFDTSYEAIVKNDSIKKAPYFHLRENYSTLIFTVGSGKVIKGLEKAVAGMKIGEVKSVEIQPEDAYGFKNAQLVKTWPRKIKIARIEKYPVQNFILFFGKAPAIGDVAPSPIFPWNITVLNVSGEKTMLNISGGNVTIQNNAEKNTVFQFPSTTWNSTVEDITDGLIIIRNDLVENTYLSTTMGLARVLKVSEDNVTIDYNSPLADEALIFEIKIENITKRK